MGHVWIVWLVVVRRFVELGRLEFIKQPVVVELLGWLGGWLVWDGSSGWGDSAELVVLVI